MSDDLIKRLRMVGVECYIVEPGHEFYNDMTDTTHVVEKGNLVRHGAGKIFMTQEDFDALKALVKWKGDEF